MSCARCTVARVTTTETPFGPISWDYIDGDIVSQGILLRGYWPSEQNAIAVARVLLDDHSDPDHFRDRPLYDWEPRARRGLYRKIPCAPFCGEHSWHLHDVDEPGRGAFEAIYVDWLYRDSDRRKVEA